MNYIWKRVGDYFMNVGSLIPTSLKVTGPMCQFKRGEDLSNKSVTSFAVLMKLSKAGP